MADKCITNNHNRATSTRRISRNLERFLISVVLANLFLLVTQLQGAVVPPVNFVNGNSNNNNNNSHLGEPPVTGVEKTHLARQPLPGTQILDTGSVQTNGTQAGAWAAQTLASPTLAAVTRDGRPTVAPHSQPDGGPRQLPLRANIMQPPISFGRPLIRGLPPPPPPSLPQRQQQQQRLAQQVAPVSAILNPVTQTTTIHWLPRWPSSPDNRGGGGGLSAANPLQKSLLSLQNPKLFGGDILLRMDRRKTILPTIAGTGGRVFKFERSALVNSVDRWPNGVIFYELEPSVSHLARLIWSVMQQFHEETCIRFVPRLNDEPDYLRIQAHRGCFSYIGRVGGGQTLSLGDGCDYRGTIAHELLHAVGFYHHQNRSDRDEFLEIMWENIAKGKEGQFEKMSPSDNPPLNEFDYNSIMLYGPRTFGKTLDKITMKPKREGVILLEVIEKQGLSALDIDNVNKLYNCGDSYAYETV